MTIPCPHPKGWRPHQEHYADAVLAALQSSDPTRLGLELPCGGGKSLGFLSAAVHSGQQIAVVSHTRAHVRQLEADAKRHWPNDVVTLYGHDYYCGVREPRPCVVCSTLVHPGWEACEQCGADREPPGCKKHDCVYWQTVERAAEAGVVIQTMAGYFLRRSMRIHNAGKPGRAEALAELGQRDLVCDEAQLLYGVLRDRVSRAATIPRHLEMPSIDPRLGWLTPIAYSAGYHQHDAAAWQRIVDTIEAERARLEKLRPHPRTAEAGWLAQCARCLALLDECSTAANFVCVAPVRAGLALQAIPWRVDVAAKLPPRAVLTSATLPARLPYTQLIKYPRILPEPRYELQVALGPKGPDGDQRRADYVRWLVDHPARNGRVVYLAMSGRDAKRVAELSGLSAHPDVLIKDGRNAVDVLNRAKANPRAVLFADSGFMAGLDLPGGMVLVLHAPTLMSPSPQLEVERILAGAPTVWATPHVQESQQVLLKQALGRAVRCETDCSAVVAAPGRGAGRGWAGLGAPWTS